jgi:cell wall-associated protease
MTAGTYQVGVWARQAGSTAAYDAYFIETFQVAGPPCASAGLTASPASPQPSGTAVTFTATSSGCTAPQYEFLGQGPGGAWRVIQPMSTSNTFKWNSAGSPSGQYGVVVWALAPGSTADYDTYAMAAFVLS